MLRLITALACALLLSNAANAQVDHSAHQHGAAPAVGSLHFLPSDLDDVYGDDPASFMLFARVKL